MNSVNSIDALIRILPLFTKYYTKSVMKYFWSSVSVCFDKIIIFAACCFPRFSNLRSSAKLGKTPFIIKIMTMNVLIYWIVLNIYKLIDTVVLYSQTNLFDDNKSVICVTSINFSYHSASGVVKYCLHHQHLEPPDDPIQMLIRFREMILSDLLLWDHIALGWALFWNKSGKSYFRNYN